MITVGAFADLIQDYYLENEGAEDNHIVSILDRVFNGYNLTLIESCEVIAKILLNAYNQVNTPLGSLYYEWLGKTHLSDLPRYDVQFIKISPHNDTLDHIYLKSDDLPVLEGVYLEKVIIGKNVTNKISASFLDHKGMVI